MCLIIHFFKTIVKPSFSLSERFLYAYLIKPTSICVCACVCVYLFVYSHHNSLDVAMRKYFENIIQPPSPSLVFSCVLLMEGHMSRFSVISSMTKMNQDLKGYNLVYGILIDLLEKKRSVRDLAGCCKNLRYHSRNRITSHWILLPICHGL